MIFPFSTPSPLPGKRSRRRAFTLMEVMVAMGVLAVIALLIAQIISATTDTTRVSAQAVDASSQARLAFDRMRLDFEALINRDDTDFIGTNNPGAATDPRLQFLSGVVSAAPADWAPEDNRGLSLVSYRVAPHPDQRGIDGQPQTCLARAGKAISWDDSFLAGYHANGLPMAFDDAEFPVGIDPNVDWDVLAPGVFRVVIGYRLFPDEQPVRLEDGSTPTDGVALGQLVYSMPTREVTMQTGGSTPTIVDVPDLSRVGAIVVGLVCVDADSLRLLTDTQITSLAAAFTTPAEDGSPVETWTPVANGLARNAALGSIPERVRQGVRVYERAFPIRQ